MESLKIEIIKNCRKQMVFNYLIANFLHAQHVVLTSGAFVVDVGVLN